MMSATIKPALPGHMVRRFLLWAKKVRLTNKLALLLAVACVCAVVATYFAVSSAPPFGQDTQTVFWLLILDLVLMLVMGALIARRVVKLWLLRKHGQAGSRLHVRLVALFSLLAVAPAIFVAVFSAVFFYTGLQSWFSDRVGTAINESLAVAEAYLEEHQQIIRADALAMANDLNVQAPQLIGNPSLLTSIVRNQAAVRALTEALVFDGSGRVLARTGFIFSFEFDPISSEHMEQARDHKVVVLTNPSSDRVRALVQLDRYVDTYLLVGRPVSPKVLQHMERSQGAVEEYTQMELKRSDLQITVTLIFVVVALLLLLAAIWLGLNFATRLATPISALIDASERVRMGDLSARVGYTGGRDELGLLGRAFNRMTDQLENQRTALVEANLQLDDRRRFSEAVLAGVSAGVLGLDHEARITFPNDAAVKLLEVPDKQHLIGKKVTDFVPSLAGLIKRIADENLSQIEEQIQIQVKSGQPRTLLVRITGEKVDETLRGFVVTFDDITVLVSAQRKAAWADVARRIAHEIKNPLTPIQLSAERLRRKYRKEVHTDPETFDLCVDTIIRHVEHIGQMVAEFSSFARMPAPKLREEDLRELCKQAIFLQRNAHPEYKISMFLPDNPITIMCDARQIGQTLTNLLQNSADAIDGREGSSLEQGQIKLKLQIEDEGAKIYVIDNGKGLPDDEREKLTEPYVTTREKGTGLGLAIVKKIMEDHGGELNLADNEETGASVCLSFPLKNRESSLQKDKNHD